MRKTLLLLFLCVGACAVALSATNETFALEGRFLDNGNILVLGYDGVSREIVMLTPGEYADLTNAVAYLNDRADFRRRIHGEVAKREVDADLKVIRHIYADGYVHVERMRAFTGTPSKPVAKTATLEPQKPAWMTAEQWAARQRRNTPRKPREIQAIFSPGGKLEEVRQ